MLWAFSRMLLLCCFAVCTFHVSCFLFSSALGLGVLFTIPIIVKRRLLLLLNSIIINANRVIIITKQFFYYSLFLLYVLLLLSNLSFFILWFYLVFLLLLTSAFCLSPILRRILHFYMFLFCSAIFISGKSKCLGPELEPRSTAG